MLYRICTEDKDPGTRERIARIVRETFECFSIWQGVGYWQRQSERSLMVEIETFDIDAGLQITRIARDIKAALEQEAVLVQTIDTKARLV